MLPQMIAFVLAVVSPAAAHAETMVRNGVVIEAIGARDAVVLCLRPGPGEKISSPFGVRVRDQDATADAPDLAAVTDSDADYLEAPIAVAIANQLMAGIDKLRVEFGVCINGSACVPTEIVMDPPKASGPRESNNACDRP